MKRHMTAIQAEAVLAFRRYQLRSPAQPIKGLRTITQDLKDLEAVRNSAGALLNPANQGDIYHY